MKYAITSDIHANPAAFKAVLDDAGRQKVDRILCLGDVTGYGYDAPGAYALVKENCDVWLLGNHDAACAGIEPDDMIRINPNYDLDVAARKELGSDRLAEIRQLPYTFSNRYFACAHGDFAAPRSFGYILYPENAWRSFSSCDRSLIFVGHTHEAKVWKLGPDGGIKTSGTGTFALADGCRYIVNVGSVGYPRHDLFSSYAVFDTRAGTVDLRRLDFDFTGYIGSFAERGLCLPRWLAGLEALGVLTKKRGLEL